MWIPRKDCPIGFAFDNRTKSCQGITILFCRVYLSGGHFEFLVTISVPRTDIDECLDASSCDAGYVCVNTEGNYECIREAEFLKSVKTNPLTSAGSKKITCEMGFRRVQNKCIDIDECAIDKAACDSNQICINEPGGFQCDCKEGFQLDATINACVGKYLYRWWVKL